MEFYQDVINNVWKENIVLSNTPLWKYENGKPIANASGCLIEYRDNIFILSIAHATIAESEWNVEVNAVEVNNGLLTTVFQPINMQSISEFNLVTEINEFTKPKLVDFTYRKLDKNFFSTDCLAILNGKHLLQAKRTIFKVDFNYKPLKNLKYGFYGKVKFNGVKNNQILFEHRLETDLKFIGKENNFLKFELPHSYGSHKNYIGCSGAPIIDENNNLVALVSYGSKKNNCIFAIDISKYRAVLDIEII